MNVESSRRENKAFNRIQEDLDVTRTLEKGKDQVCTRILSKRTAWSFVHHSPSDMIYLLLLSAFVSGYRKESPRFNFFKGQCHRSCNKLQHLVGRIAFISVVLFAYFGHKMQGRLSPTNIKYKKANCRCGSP